MCQGTLASRIVPMHPHLLLPTALATGPLRPEAKFVSHRRGQGCGRPAHTVRVSPWASARRCHDRHSTGHSPSVGRRSDPSACEARPGCLAVFRCSFEAALANISRLIFSMDDPRCVNGRSHGCQVCTFDRVSKCVTPGLLLTEPEHTSSSSSPILTRSQAWPETPSSGDSMPSTTVAGNVQRKANTGLASIPSWS